MPGILRLIYVFFSPPNVGRYNIWGCQARAVSPQIDVLRPRLGPKIRGPLIELHLILVSFDGPLILGPCTLEGYPGDP